MKEKKTNRPAKYNKRKNTQPKKSYSLRSLVGEITGVEENDYSFEAAYKAVQRIVQVMKKITGNQEKRQSIPHEEKAGFVLITRKLYNMIKNDPTNKGQELFSRIRQEKPLTEEELVKLIDWFKEALEANTDSELHRWVLERVKAEERFFSWMDEVKERMLRDFALLEKIESISQREQRMKEYLSILKDGTALQEWRSQVNTDYQHELFKKKMIVVAREKGFNVQEVLEGKNLELLEEVTSEIIQRDVEYYLKHSHQTMETDSE
jgi:hypothetical protein